MPFGTAHEPLLTRVPEPPLPELDILRSASVELRPVVAEPAIPPAKVLPLARLFELSGQRACARTSTAVSWLLDAQAQGELTVWVQPVHGSLFPPDLAKAGVDLRSLVVVQVPNGQASIRATEMLLRSGAFGLVVIDLTDALPLGSPSRWQGRLQALLRKHDCRVCLLTSSEVDEPSAGPLVELRLQATRVRREPGRALLHHEIIKNKVGVRAHISRTDVTVPAGL